MGVVHHAGKRTRKAACGMRRQCRSADNEHKLWKKIEANYFSSSKSVIGFGFGGD